MVAFTYTYMVYACPCKMAHSVQSNKADEVPNLVLSFAFGEHVIIYCHVDNKIPNSRISFVEICFRSGDAYFVGPSREVAAASGNSQGGE